MSTFKILLFFNTTLTGLPTPTPLVLPIMQCVRLYGNNGAIYTCSTTKKVIISCLNPWNVSNLFISYWSQVAYFTIKSFVMSQILFVSSASYNQTSVSSENVLNFEPRMWKQPSSVEICTHILLHSEAQTSNCRNMKKNTLLMKGGL